MSNSPFWLQILLALLGSSVISTIISSVLSPIIARQEIRKLEVTYRQKLNDNFIQNTRQYIDTLYIPIYKSLSILEDNYKIYKRRKAHLKSIKKGKVKISPPVSPGETNAKIQSLRSTYCAATEEALEDLNQAYGNFRSFMEELTNEGTDSYLTAEFDERLRSFTHFLKAAADDGYLIASTGKDIEGNLNIDSKSFDNRFLTDIRYLKSYIKEITLGTAQHK